MVSGRKIREAGMTLAYRQTLQDESLNPLEHVELLAASNDWPIARTGEDEAQMAVSAAGAELQITMSWREDTESLYLACMFDLKAPAARRAEVARLINMINERLLMGHFDFWTADGLAIYRNALLLSGGAQATEAQCESLIALALQACERYYPAFQFVIWAGKTAQDAISACLFETAGNA